VPIRLGNNIIFAWHALRPVVLRNSSSSLVAVTEIEILYIHADAMQPGILLSTVNSRYKRLLGTGKKLLIG